MVGRSKILEISRSAPLEAPVAAALEDDDAMIAAIKRGHEEPYVEVDTNISGEIDLDSSDYETDEGEPIPRRWAPIFTALALGLLFVGWSGFWGWAYQRELLLLGPPARIVELVALWAMPASLLALGWLLAMRLSTAEARRFGDVTASLRAESEALEARIKTINGEIALARSFLAENARELESIGRASSKKLTEAAEHLVAALADSDEKAKLLETVSSAAISNIDMLRNHLPVVTSAAKDTANQIGHAGNMANEQMQNLLASLRSMEETIAATSVAMAKLQSQADETGHRIESAAQEAGAKFETATSESEARVAALLATLQSEIANIEQRIGETSENITALSESGQQQLTEQVELLRKAVLEIGDAAHSQDDRFVEIVSRLNNALENSEHRLTQIDDNARARLVSLVDQIGGSISDFEDRLSLIDGNATDRIAKLAFALSALSESSSDLAVNLNGNEEKAAAMLADAEKLITALGSVAGGLNGDIAAALDGLQRRFAESNNAVSALAGESGALEILVEKLAAKFNDLDGLLEAQKASIIEISAASSDSLVERQREADALTASLNATHSLIADVATTAEEQLAGTLQRVADAANEAANSSKAIVETELAEIRSMLSEQNRALLTEAVDLQLAGLGSAVREAIDRNIQLSEEATRRVTAQLHAVNELTVNLEQRVASARTQFDGIDDEAFARRIALLTESLNSAAIDVAKILSNEITDTAWASYLKGDRGVFTRRAVRLLDNGEAKIIANHYNEDMEFRDHVNRYIHDFEAMMRVLLSTRDGNAIGVTLLSSDVGKLYVALAQAIDRLRN